MTTGAHQKLDVVIVDDERPARDELRYLMQGYRDVNVVGEAATVEQARDVLDRARPDVVLLDIQLQDRSGFEVTQTLEPGVQVIFVTAYGHHAVRAFEVRALDYLLKPVEPDRLRAALDRVKGRASGTRSRHLKLEDVLLLKTARQYLFVRVEQIRYITAEGEYTEVDAEDGGGLSERTLSTWEAILPTDRFARVHRATIVNLHAVKTMTSGPGGSHELVLRNDGVTISVSRRYAARLRERLG